MASDLKTCSRCNKVYSESHRICPHCLGLGSRHAAAGNNISYLPIAGIVVGIVLVSVVAARYIPARSDDPPPKLFVAQSKIDKAQQDERLRQVAQGELVLEANLKKATSAQIKTVLSACTSAITSLYEKANKTGFGAFIVDEDSAPAYQLIVAKAGSSGELNFLPVESSEQRAKEFMEQRKRHETSDLQSLLNLRYAVIFTRDSFSGPEKFPVRYSCTLTPQLGVVAQRDD